MFGAQSVEQDEEQGRSPFSRFGRWFKGRDDEDEEYEEAEPVRPVAAPAAQARPQRREGLRFATAGREDSIRVMPVASFSDIQKAADCLKAGEPQIVNLEKTPADVAERLIDFLNGVTYALDGYVEKIAEAAYLFTPPHIAIHAEASDPGQARPFVNPQV